MHVAALHDGDERGRLTRCDCVIANCFLRAGFLGDIDDRKARIVHRAIRRRDGGRALPVLRATSSST